MNLNTFTNIEITGVEYEISNKSKCKWTIHIKYYCWVSTMEYNF